MGIWGRLNSSNPTAQLEKPNVLNIIRATSLVLTICVAACGIRTKQRTAAPTYFVVWEFEVSSPPPHWDLTVEYQFNSGGLPKAMQRVDGTRNRFRAMLPVDETTFLVTVYSGEPEDDDDLSYLLGDPYCGVVRIWMSLWRDSQELIAPREVNVIVQQIMSLAGGEEFQAGQTTLQVPGWTPQGGCRYSSQTRFAP